MSLTDDVRWVCTGDTFTIPHPKIDVTTPVISVAALRAWLEGCRFEPLTSFDRGELHAIDKLLAELEGL
jgi:hypothetical protein